jgi:hypothetical protein
VSALEILLLQGNNESVGLAELRLIFGIQAGYLILELSSVLLNLLEV